MRKLFLFLSVLSLTHNVYGKNIYTEVIDPMYITVKDISMIYDEGPDVSKSMDELNTFLLNMYQTNGTMGGIKRTFMLWSIDTNGEYDCLNAIKTKEVRDDIIKRYKNNDLKGNEEYFNIYDSYFLKCFSKKHREHILELVNKYK